MAHHKHFCSPLNRVFLNYRFNRLYTPDSTGDITFYVCREETNSRLVYNSRCRCVLKKKRRKKKKHRTSLESKLLISRWRPFLTFLGIRKALASFISCVASFFVFPPNVLTIQRLIRWNTVNYMQISLWTWYLPPVYIMFDNHVA